MADYLLSRAKAEGVKNLVTVSNLSSSRALRDVTESYGGTYYSSAVGEVNVTTLMHEKGALIGGEGNGGVIYPAIHSGRDAMVGVALFLSNLAHKKMKVSELKKTYPEYHIAKNRIELSDKSLIDKILTELKKIYANEMSMTLTVSRSASSRSVNGCISASRTLSRLSVFTPRLRLRRRL